MEKEEPKEIVLLSFGIGCRWKKTENRELMEIDGMWKGIFS